MKFPNWKVLEIFLFSEKQLKAKKKIAGHSFVCQFTHLNVKINDKLYVSIEIISVSLFIHCEQIYSHTTNCNSTTSTFYKLINLEKTL